MPKRSGFILLMVLAYGLLLLPWVVMGGRVVHAFGEQVVLRRTSLAANYLVEAGVRYGVYLVKRFPEVWASGPAFSLPLETDPFALRQALFTLPSPSFQYDMTRGKVHLVKRAGADQFYAIGYTGETMATAKGRAVWGVTYTAGEPFQILVIEGF